MATTRGKTAVSPTLHPRARSSSNPPPAPPTPPTPPYSYPRCLSAGQCVDICQRPDIKAVVEESQRRYKPCSSSDACARGEECTLPQFPCSLVQCNPHAISKGMDFVEFVACPKICLPEAPKMINASFSDEGDRITVRGDIHVQGKKGLVAPVGWTTYAGTQPRTKCDHDTGMDSGMQ